MANNLNKHIKSLTNKNKNLVNEVDRLNKIIEFEGLVDLKNLTSLDDYTIISNKSLKEQATAISQLGDIHIDEQVSKSMINGLNEYNPEIATLRMEKYFKRLLYLVNQSRKGGIKIENLVLHLAGDGISGWIHDELKQTNVITPIQAVVLLEENYIKGLKLLSEQGKFKKIIVICTIGNHSRTTEKNQFKNAAITSYEYIVYKHIIQVCSLLGLTNLEFKLSDSQFIYYKIYDKINMFSHGNHFRYQGGIGGIEVPIKKWILRENAVNHDWGGIDMAWIGHWHTYLNLQHVRVNGSVIGYNEMGRSYGFTPEPPMQQFQLLDSKRGYTLNNPIILTEF